MKIVFVALQRMTANGYCASSVIHELLRRGHEVVWVCNREPMANLPENATEFVQVEPRWIDFQLAKHGDSPLAKSLLVTFNRLGMLRALKSWPLVSKRYSSRVTEAVKAASSDADVVIGVYTQIDAIIAAHEAKKHNPQLRFIAWYLDSFAGGHGPRFLSSEDVERRGKRWDNELLANADSVIAMESSRRFHETHCSEEPWFNKLQFLDLPLLDLSVSSDLRSGNGVIGAKTIVYAGSLPAGIRSPDFFLEAMKRIPDEPIHLIFVGDASNRALAEASAHDKRIEVKGRLPHEEILRLLASSDYLLSLGNRLANMTPSKIFEYMTFRKPIIATYPIDEEPSITYLKRYGDALMLDERGDPSVAAAAIARFVQAKHEPISTEELKNKFWNNTPSAFCDLIEISGGKDAF